MFVSISTVIINPLQVHIHSNNNNKNNNNNNNNRSRNRTGEEERERHLPGHEKGTAASEISRVQCPLLYNMPRGSPEVATLSNTIDNGLKQTDFQNWPFLRGLTQLK